MFQSSLATPAGGRARTASYTLVQLFSSSSYDQLMALLSLSHTPLEDQLYRAMLAQSESAGEAHLVSSVRRLTSLSGIQSSTNIRRALNGLQQKQSIQTEFTETRTPEQNGRVFRVFTPREIFERRWEAGIAPYPKGMEMYGTSNGFGRAISRIVDKGNLSRREAQVALACAEGITNAEIAARLSVSEQTVKFHLRNIFSKFGVRRRTELIAHLLMQDSGP